MESKEKCPSDSPTSPRLFEILSISMKIYGAKKKRRQNLFSHAIWPYLGHWDLCPFLLGSLREVLGTKKSKGIYTLFVKIFPNVVKFLVSLMSGGEGGILLYTIVVPKFFLRFAISKEVNTHSYLGLFGPSEFLYDGNGLP